MSAGINWNGFHTVRVGYFYPLLRMTSDFISYKPGGYNPTVCSNAYHHWLGSQGARDRLAKLQSVGDEVRTSE